MVTTPASQEPEDESLEERAGNDSGDDAAYVERPTVRSQPLYTPRKVFLTIPRRKDAPSEKKER